MKAESPDTITGYSCACTPYTDHPGSSGSSRRADNPYGQPGREQGVYSNKAGEYERVGPWREYHAWTPAPTIPAVILDPFGGTGTTALMAKALGRHGISVDMSADYCRLATWRTTDPREMARALEVEKPPEVHPDQLDLFGGEFDAAPPPRPRGGLAYSKERGQDCVACGYRMQYAGRDSCEKCGATRGERAS